jgi:metallophosphoesterase (TIGR00282 family)
MKILFFGDVSGRVGRKGLISHLPKLKDKYKPNLIIVNAENLAHGTGLTIKTVSELVRAGIMACTTGNHAWRKEDPDLISDTCGIPVVTPANDARTNKEKRWQLLDVGGKKVALINLLGQTFMDDENVFSAFTVFDELYNELLSKDVKVIIVDFHAEATSEKIAFAWHVDGRATVVAGTHTHVQTNDERILPNGTAYITDIGMCGPSNTVLGVDRQTIINKFLTNQPIIFSIPESGPVDLSAVLVCLDEQTNKAVTIEKIYLPGTII